MSVTASTHGTLTSRGARTALSLIASAGLLLVQGGFVAVAPVAASNASSATLDQCANGKTGTPRVPCTGSNWQNGNINSNNSQYREGDSVPFRALITVPTSATAVTHHTIWVQYDSTVSSKHAYDYLTTWNATETGDPTSGQTGISSTALVPITPGADEIPPPIDLQTSTCTLASAQVLTSPGVMTLYGPTGAGITGVTYTPAPSGTAEPTNCQGTANSVTVQVGFDVPASSAGTANLVLAWGGHIGTEQSWGTGNSAVAISGSPYHERILQIDNTSIGNQDRSLKASAVLVQPTIVTQVATGSPFAIGSPVTDLATVSGTVGTPTGTVTFFLCSGSCPSSSTGGTQVGSAVTLNGSGQATSAQVNTSTGSFPTGPLAPGEYCFRVAYTPASGSQYAPGTETDSSAECFSVAKASPTIATTANPTSGALNTTLQDSATLTGASNLDGTGSITFYLYAPGTTCATDGTGATYSETVSDITSSTASTTTGYVADQAGTWNWVAVFSGDGNNNGAHSACGDEAVTITGGTFGFTPGFWQNQNGHAAIDSYNLLPVLLGDPAEVLRYFNVDTIAKSDTILPPPNGCDATIFNCSVTGLSQDLSTGTFNNLTMQTLALAYNIKYFGDVGTTFGTQTLGQLGATPVPGLTSSSTVQDVLNLADQLIANSASGGTTTQAQASAMVNLISYIDSV